LRLSGFLVKQKNRVFGPCAPYLHVLLESQVAAGELWAVLKTTPFHSRTAALVRAQAWRRWAGYQVASAYDSPHEREYAAIRSAAALFDVSPLCKYQVSGRDATLLLDRMVTRNIAALAPGRVVYTTWCDARGKVIDDGTVARLDEMTYRLTSAEPSLRWLSMNAAGFDVALQDVSDTTAALALQGPLARAVLENAGASSIAAIPWFGLSHAGFGDLRVTITRTGYTGDLGYELWVDADRAVELWDLLMGAGSAYGLTPAGIWALDVARIEAGLIMLGVDYHSAQHALIDAQFSSPLELGLAWTVKTAAKGPFNGRAALLREMERDPEWLLVGIDVDWESLERLFAARGLPPTLPTVAWRSSVPVYHDGTQIGYATSGCWSPLLKKYIALAHIRAPHHAPGTRIGFEVTVEHERRIASGTVTRLPFLNLPRKRE
jgi:aminomethyltransferase